MNLIENCSRIEKLSIYHKIKWIETRDPIRLTKSFTKPITCFWAKFHHTNQCMCTVSVGALMHPQFITVSSVNSKYLFTN